MNKKILVTIAVVVVAFGVGFGMSRRAGQKPATGQTNTSDSSHSAVTDKTVDMSGQQLTTLPDSLLSQTEITSLNVSNNQLTSLTNISVLVNLEVLNVENNRLESFPPEMNQLKNLREIRANNNRLTTLPTELETMTWLQSLDVSGNNIPQSDIAQLKAKLPKTQIKN